MAAFNEIYCNGLNIIELSAKIGQESTLQVCIHNTFDSISQYVAVLEN